MINPFLEKRIYLASRSPRRPPLLKQIGVAFDLLLLREDNVRGPDVDETPLDNEDPREYVKRIAATKAEVGWAYVVQRRLPLHAVLAADTAVVLDNKILGKPKNHDMASGMLKSLSGRSHEVYTAVSICLKDRVDTLLSVSQVEFRELQDHDIKRYILSGEAMDKAGAYAIQGRAAIFVKNISGSYSGIVGLPLFETAQLLARFGYEVL